MKFLIGSRAGAALDAILGVSSDVAYRWVRSGPPIHVARPGRLREGHRALPDHDRRRGAQSATPPGFPTNKAGCPLPFGGAGWVTTEAPVVPGEIITVQFIVWDSSDPVFDSAAIFDNFHGLTGSLPNPKTYRP